MTPQRLLLRQLFDAAVASATPEQCLPPHLPPPPPGRLIILAGGKAAASMTAAALGHYRTRYPASAGRIEGIAVTRTGYGRPLDGIAMVEAGHPVPDRAGEEATRRVLELAASAGADDLVLVLLSGGASANWVAPAPGIDLATKQALTRELLRSGAPISEINTVRRHLSRIKGGRLARVAAPAPVVALAISDVPGDLPLAIGSGPTVPDPTTLADALRIVSERGLDIPPAVAAALRDPANETPKPGDSFFGDSCYEIVARPGAALDAAARLAVDAGYEVRVLGDALEGEARDVGAAHARLAREFAAAGRRALLLSGGELTVTLRGDGHGGPNQEYALALAIGLAGVPTITALAADTDGTDGGSGMPSDPAGAFAGPETLSRAASHGLDPAAFLANNDSTAFFTALGDLLETGPTLTNVNDFRAILVDSPKAAAR